MRSFGGRVAVVTGAASGIGRALAEQLARRGCGLALVDVDAAGLERLALRLEGQAPRVSLHPVDVSRRERMEALPGEVLREHGAVHLLVNNAGVDVATPFAEQSLEDFEWLVGVNFWGVVYGCKFFLPHLLRAREAHIVNVSSVFGFAGLPTQSSYCATKFAARGFSEALWAELRPRGVGVTCVHPGAVRTNLVRTARTTDPESRDRNAARFERWAMPPERAARRILRAVERNRLRVLVGADAHLGEWLKRLFPVSLHRLAAGRRRRAAEGPRADAGP